MLIGDGGLQDLTISDQQLVSASQSGNPEAYAELIRRHRTKCSQWAFAILRNRQDAEDEVQNALWKAFTHINQFRANAQFSTWLNRIIVNQCLMRLRQAHRARYFNIDNVQIGETKATFEICDRRFNPEQELTAKESATLLRRELGRLPPLLRRVIVLRDLEELDMKSVASQLGLSTAAAKSRLLRARLEIRERMLNYSGLACPVGPTNLKAAVTQTIPQSSL